MKNTIKMSTGKKIYYFAYGSNMLSDRFFVSNKGTRKGPGILNDFMLGFNAFVSGWNGGVVAIIRKKGSIVEGAVWEVDEESIKTLDIQEEFYNRITVDIELRSGEIIQCETYEFKDSYMLEASDESVKYATLPSLTYLKVIVKGAEESNLHKDYIHFLRTMNHNGKAVDSRESMLHLEDFHL
ncbi:GGCT.2 family protein [Megaselia abdita]